MFRAAGYLQRRYTTKKNMTIEKINSKDFFGREIFFISVSSIEDFNFENIPKISKYFTLFISNNSELDVDLYFDKAKDFIKSGLAYMCAWGNKNELIHDLFDEASVMLEVDGEIKRDENDNVVMTTSHQDESIKEALEYFLMNTSPTDKYYDDCKTALVLVVGNSSDGDNLKLYLENQNLLDDD
jgi:hypothetical protein